MIVSTMGAHFRDPRIAASLKLDCAFAWPPILEIFPRSPDRGLIEANFPARMTSDLRKYFRDPRIAASLKQNKELNVDGYRLDHQNQFSSDISAIPGSRPH